MKISHTMSLGELMERMGKATEAQAQALRDILVDRYDSGDTANIDEGEWLSLLDTAVAQEAIPPFVL